MTFIKKNIWTAFYFITLIWCIFFAASSYLSYKAVYEKYTSEQQKLMALTANSFQSIMNQYEVMLNLIGKEVTNNSNLADKTTIQRIMDNVIDTDKSMLGVGLFLPNGDVYAASSDVKLPPNFNLLEQPENRDAFMVTLQSKQMVLGRTYLSNALNAVGFPLRKAVQDKNGKTLFILSTVVDIRKGFQFFLTGKSNEGSHDLYLYRDQDNYFQAVLSKNLVNNSIYDYKIPPSARDIAIAESVEYAGVPYQAIKDNQIDVITKSLQPGSSDQDKAVSKFIPKYKLWAELKIDTQYINTLFLKEFFILLAIFSSSLFLIFLLFRSIANNNKQVKSALEHQANHDYLTGLHNRFYLDKQLSNPKKYNSFHLIFIDLDNFKIINDGYGHEVGDRVLCQVASRLREMVENEKTNILVRYSGDEFIIVVFGYTADQVDTFCHQILLDLSEPCLVKDYRLILGASIGIAAYPEDGDTLDKLKRYADLAMYEAKKNRNTVTFFRESFREAYRYRALMEQELKHAAQRNELFMMYQPQIRRNGGTFGVEALIRWENKQLGRVPPDKFIPVAEACGEMLTIGDFIIDRTFADINQVRQETGLPVTVSINISVRQFQHNEFFEKLIKLMEKHTFIHIELVLEVTENLFIEDVIGIQALMHRIKEKGIRISLDDFGTGYSSLSLLNQLPIDELKIDKSFIDDITTNKNTLAMVEGIIAIARKLDIVTVVEGIETDEQRQILSNLQCDIFQGYHFSKPLTLSELKTFIKENTHLLKGIPAKE